MTQPRPELSSTERKRLRGKAHELKPIVHVGAGGISDAVVREVDRALRSHELIKVKLQEPEDKKALAEQLAEATSSALCGLLGHTVILFRERDPESGA